LTEDGKSDYAIVLSEAASRSEQHAAGELQRFLEEISGAKLPIVHGGTEAGRTSERRIVLGNGEQLRSLKVQIDFAGLGEEGFVIKSAGPHLVIAGGRLRGTMYGVYTFLEDVLGCRWYTSKVSHIPKNPSITLELLDITQKPDFEYREPFYFDAFDADWAARNKSNSTHPENAVVARQLEECRKKVLPELLTYGSVQAHLDAEVLVPEGVVWRYLPGKQAPSPGLEWAQGDFDDRSWKEGKSGFGYGDDDDATVLDDMQNAYTTLYIRRSFDVVDPSSYKKVVLSVSVDDGFVAYLNGVEVGRSNVEDPSPGADGTAHGSVGEPLVAVSVELSPRKGRNFLALHGLNCALASSDFSLVPAVTARSKPDPKRYRPLFEKYLAETSKPTNNVATYFEGQVLASEGKHREAAEKFRLVRELDRSRREPFDRLLESLRASGHTVEAERLLREERP
jgi:hypothetical protein